MPNVKISELNKANRLSDEALIVVVQDNSNKVVTVKELGEKINHNQNALLAKLHDEIKQSSQGGNIIKLKDIAAKHEYRLNTHKLEIDKLKQKDNDTDKVIKIIGKDIHDLKHLSHKVLEDNANTRKGLGFIFNKVNTVSDTVQNLQEITEETVEIVKEILSYTHRTPEDYWGVIKL